MLQRRATPVTKARLLIFFTETNPRGTVGNRCAKNVVRVVERMNRSMSRMHRPPEIVPAMIANTNESAPDSDWVVRRMTNGRQPAALTLFLESPTGMQHERRTIA